MAIIAGKRYEAEDPIVRAYNKMVMENFDVLQGPIQLVDMMPWLAYLLPSVVIKKYMGMDTLCDNRDTFTPFCQVYSIPNPLLYSVT